MLYSMTGFGYALTEISTMTITAEVKSINSKYFDLSMRTPRNFPVDKDLELRNVLKDALQRGKVSANVEIQYKDTSRQQTSINASLLKEYYSQLKTVADELQTPTDDLFRLAALMPEVIVQDSSRTEFLEEEWQAIQQTLREAIQKCETFRAQEGAVLARAFTDYTHIIEARLVNVHEADAPRMEHIRQKVKTRAAELLGEEAFDANRFEQEMIYYMEKLDIAEEKVRLKNHLDYFLKTLQGKDASGRKLNFITQEIGREINTIGSKANDAAVQRFVVEMKDELEKIKEQLANIL